MTDEETATGSVGAGVETTTREVAAGVERTTGAVEAGGVVTGEDSTTGTVAAVTSPA